MIVNVTLLGPAPETVLPPRSCTATRGCVVKTMPPVEELACLMKPIFAWLPTVTVVLRLVAVNAPSTACSV